MSILVNHVQIGRYQRWAVVSCITSKIDIAISEPASPAKPTLELLIQKDPIETHLFHPPNTLNQRHEAGYQLDKSTQDIHKCVHKKEEFAAQSGTWQVCIRPSDTVEQTTQWSISRYRVIICIAL